MLRRENIRIIRRLGFGRSEDILGTASSPAFIDIPSKGIYTLEGPNQSGKSLLIKLLSGALPRSVESSEHRTTIRSSGDQSRRLIEKQVRIRDVRSAMNCGVYAVHQDDDLLPTLTVREQIFLRHATPDLFTWVYIGVEWLLHSTFARFAQNASTAADRLIESADALRHVKKLEIERQAIEEFGRLGQSKEILDKYPWELSGGAKAIVRLVSVRLYKNIRILLLDEIFNAVDRNTWPKTMAIMREWQQQTGAAVLVVSHNTDELLRWQPCGRFEIRDRQIRDIGVKGAHSVHLGIPSRIRSFAVFEPTVEQGEKRYMHPWFWRPGDKGTFVVICSEQLRSVKPTLRILAFLRAQGFNIRALSARVGEAQKSVDYFAGFAKTVLKTVVDIAQKQEPPLFAFCAIGGGTLLNTAGFVTGTLFRGRIPTVWVPTTITAVADVAIGSKTSLNSTAGIKAKNIIGAYSNPAAVVLDEEFISSLPSSEKRDGLAECYKHGLLQDENLYEMVRDAIHEPTPTVRLAQIAKQVMMMKSEILSRFPFESEAGRLLRYGHVHAHALERASNFLVSHASAVFWGILLELKIAKSDALLAKVLEAIAPVIADHSTAWVAVDINELRNAYVSDVVDAVHQYRPIIVTKVGEYGNPVNDRINEGGEVGIEEMLRAIYQLRGLVQAQAHRNAP